MTAIEHRYRRLLRWYPRDHRRDHEDEMLGVLLAGTEPGQSRPSLRDAFDLIHGGLWIRLRRAPRSFAHAQWREAVTLVSLFAPLLMLAAGIRYVLNAGLIMSQAHDVASKWTGMFHSAPLWLAWVVVAALALAGARGTAAAGALVTSAAHLGLLIWYDSYWGLVSGVPILLGLLAAAALGLSPGAVRGREVLGRGGFTGAIAIAIIVGVASSPPLRFELSQPVRAIAALAPIAAAVAVAGWLLRSPAGRRAGILLIIPLSSALLQLYPIYIESSLVKALLTLIIIPVVAVLLVAAMIGLLERLIIPMVSAPGRGTGSTAGTGSE